MEFDCIISSIPPYTSITPSISITSLYSFLINKGIKCYSFDFSPSFFKNQLKKFNIPNPFKFKFPLFTLLGYMLWYYKADDFFLYDNVGEYILKSLSPIHYTLYSQIFNKLYQKIPELYKILYSYSQKLVNLDTEIYCFSINITNAITTLKIIHEIKQQKPDSIIILGGPELFPVYRREMYADLKMIDYVIYHNEGELPLYYLIDSLINNSTSTSTSVPGLAFKKNNTIFTTPPPVKLDLNKLPLLKYNEIDYNGFKFEEFQRLELLTTKGCSGQCSFCNEPFIWNPIASKNPSYLVKEIKFYINEYGINRFEITDNAFNVTNNFIKTLDLLKLEHHSIYFGGNCKLNKLNNDKLNHYKELGLTHCFYGLESGSQKILNLMNKNLSLEHAINMIKNTAKLGIDVILYLIIGFPGESNNDYELTLQFLEKYKDYITDISVSAFTLMNDSPVFNSSLLTPIRLGSKILNCYDYKTNDNITHEIRSERYLKLKNFWNSIQVIE
ncbi:MAG: B12-binding domain-containing radical SAM protein [Candidatus Helarchaeota archaeon]